jgi:Outer membrane protein beta-barrel domain
MKKSTLFLLMCALGISSWAQEQEWKIAFHVDPNVSWLKPDHKDIEQEGNKLRFGFGVSIDKMFTDNYAIGTGLNLLTTGGELTYLNAIEYDLNGKSTNMVTKVTRNYSMKYIEIPLTLKLRTNEIGYITYWGQMGLGLGFNYRAKADEEITFVKQKIEDDPNTTNDNEEAWIDAQIAATTVEDEDVASDIADFRTSLIAGLGIEYNISGSTSLVAGLIYNNGFSDALRGKGVTQETNGSPVFSDLAPRLFDLKSMNNLISLQVGILF